MLASNGYTESEIDSLPHHQKIVVGSILLVGYIVGQLSVCAFGGYLAISFFSPDSLPNRITFYLVDLFGWEGVLSGVSILAIVTCIAHWKLRKPLNLPDCTHWQIVTIIGALGYLWTVIM